jgi:hypothetical protein
MSDSAPRRSPPTRKTKAELLHELVKDRLGTILVLLAVLLGILFYIGYSPSIPREMKLVGLSAIVFTPWAYLVGQRVVDWLHDPYSIWVVDLDAERTDGALYELSPPQFRDLESRKGQFCQLSPNLWTAKDVDLDDLEATGTWRGTLSDAELLRSLQNVTECRGRLENQARKGFVWQTSGPVLVREATRETTETVVEMFASGSLPDNGDALYAAVDDVLENWDFDEVADEIDNRELPDEFDIELSNEEMEEVLTDLSEPQDHE